MRNLCITSAGHFDFLLYNEPTYDDKHVKCDFSFIKSKYLSVPKQTKTTLV
jgi:hypothetical protein